ncbi:PucR family transcriptional regulator [Actinokineospora enzanensis]|uniref:PucR family transcriptional regulator n=1 Tax=Actinokineospora enzanensis TaxID=155975 RepID=UPI00035C1FFD|nr:helix-turn-helix domain-containing protein [Actinokineospora enzanensis]
MTDLFDRFRRAAAANGRLVVDTCSAELPEYAATIARDRDQERMLEFAVFIRRRTADLAQVDEPLTAADLAVVTEIGRERGDRGMPHSVLPRVLAVHAAATFREIETAAGGGDLTETIQLLGWLSTQSTIAQRAYTSGFLQGQQRFLSEAGRARQFADQALAGEPAADLGFPLAGAQRVIVVASVSSVSLEVVWNQHRVPVTRAASGEVVVLLPAEQETRGLTETLGRVPMGTAVGAVENLPETYALARGICRVARTPGHLSTVGDVLLELAVADLPELTGWLDGIAGRLVGGADLLSTLDAFYQADLDRARAAGALHIHPRTLDYRLRKVRELTGVDPRSTHGIRVLTTVIGRAPEVSGQRSHPGPSRNP